MAAQNFDANAVEGSEPYGSCDVANHIFDTFFHFPGGTVGKRYNQAFPGVGFTVRQNIGQPGCQHFGFAGAGAGQNQQRAFGGFDRFFCSGLSISSHG